MKLTPKLFIYGFLTWLIPFLFSFAFVGPGGEMWIEETFFKTIMVVTGALVGTFYLVRYFRGVTANHMKVGLMVGLIWFAINIILDLILVLVGFFPYTVVIYFTDIGLRYLALPIFAYGMGAALEHKK